MNLALLLSGALKAAPTVIAGVEYLAKEESSATKQQLALDSLTVLTSTVAAGIPGTEAVAGAVNTALSAIINLTVAAFNAAGTFTHKTAAAA